MATIVYDDDDSHLTYTSVQPLQALGSIYFGGNGISISLFGWVSEDLPINVMLDGTIQSGVQFDAKEPKTINALYHFPNLSDTRHSLTIMPNNSSPSASGQCISVIDYVTVVAGENTSLDGKRLIVDESDPSVVFEGSWTPSNTAVLRTRFNSVVRRPYGNATRQTSSVNASATFHFNGWYSTNYYINFINPTYVTGTSVSVFGVNDLIPPESVTVSYNLDGDLTSQVYSFGNSTNFKWYHVDDLSPTVHELIMTLEDARNNASFNLDYIIYTPSFKPDPTPTPHGSGTTMSSTDHGVSHAALLGAIIGPIIFAAVVGILLVMRRKKLWFSRQRPNIGKIFRSMVGSEILISVKSTLSVIVIIPLKGFPKRESTINLAM
ncbi:hypothetical protein C0993_008200 [Termitomyces sp. T159_Od127]|nr:hypothetical protein C0993_008200 [Termitomyces sp. T159_Od127]